MLTHTVADVATGPLADTKVRGLEVNGVLPAGVVGASQISGTRDQLGKDVVDSLEAGLGKLTGSDGSISRLVDGELLLPALGQLAGETASEVSTLGLVLGLVLLEELVPLLLLGSTLSGVLVVQVVNLLGDSEALLGVEAEKLLNALGIVGLEGVSVDTAGTGKLGAETNGGGQLDHGGLVSNLLTLADGSLDTREVVVTILDPLGVPAVGLETLSNVLSESTLGVTICGDQLSAFVYLVWGTRANLTNGDVVVIVDGNQVAKLKVTGHGGSLAGNTLHSATITEEHVGVVVEKLEAGLVVDTTGVGLSHGETNSVGKTLTERTSGDLNTGGVVSLGVTGGDAVELLLK